MKNALKHLTAAALISMAVLTNTPAAFAQTADKPYTYVEQMPVFKGGEAEMMKFLGSNINYPEDAVKAGVKGLVVLSFVIDASGSVGEVKVVKSLSGSTDAEATRVVKMTDGKWQPGKQNGKAVPVVYTLPIKFAMKDTPKGTSSPDKQPQFKGGQEALMQTINQHLKMPEEAKQEHLNARVVVKFTVEKDGTVANIKLASTKLKKTVGPDAKLDYMDASTFNLQNKTILAKLAEAAAAAVKATSGHWQPAIKNGEPVAAELVLPVQFLGAEAEGKGALLVEPAKQKTGGLAQASSAAPSRPAKEIPGELAKFFGKNLRHPGTDAESLVAVKYEVLENGSLRYEFGKGQDRELQDEVLRVLKLTREEGLMKYDGQGLQPLAVRFVVNDGTGKQRQQHAALPADVVVTRYK